MSVSSTTLTFSSSPSPEHTKKSDGTLGKRKVEHLSSSSPLQVIKDLSDIDHFNRTLKHYKENPNQLRGRIQYLRKDSSNPFPLESSSDAECLTFVKQTYDDFLLWGSILQNMNFIRLSPLERLTAALNGIEKDSLTDRIIQVFGGPDKLIADIPELRWDPEFRKSKYIESIEAEDLPKGPLAWGTIDNPESPTPPNFFIAMRTCIVDPRTGKASEPTVETIHMVQTNEGIQWTSGGTYRIVERAFMTEENFTHFKELVTNGSYTVEPAQESSSKDKAPSYAVKLI